MNRWEYEDAYLGRFPSQQEQQEIDEQCCIKILYRRVTHIFPRLNPTDIERAELENGTILFIGGVDGAVQADIDNRRDAWCNEYKIGGPIYFEGPEVNISVPAPWAFIVYKDGKIIDEDSCKRAIIRQWVIETLEKERKMPVEKILVDGGHGPSRGMTPEQVSKIMADVRSAIYCEQCGENPRLYARGKLHKLCASCGLKNLLYFIYHWQHRLSVDIGEYRRWKWMTRKVWRIRNGLG